MLVFGFGMIPPTDRYSAFVLNIEPGREAHIVHADEKLPTTGVVYYYKKCVKMFGTIAGFMSRLRAATFLMLTEALIDQFLWVAIP
jgi:hypothetical protein